MKCPGCQHANEAGAKFCEECAGPLARRFCPECAHPAGPAVPATTARRFVSPESYTPKYLAEKILTSKAPLERERNQVTVLFADLKGSMELLADRDPEEARKILGARRHVPDDPQAAGDWLRIGTTPTRGTLTMEAYARYLTEPDLEHLAQLEATRAVVVGDTDWLTASRRSPSSTTGG